MHETKSSGEISKPNPYLLHFGIYIPFFVP